MNDGQLQTVEQVRQFLVEEMLVSNTLLQNPLVILSFLKKMSLGWLRLPNIAQECSELRNTGIGISYTGAE